MRDPTGLRRFWTVETGAIDTDALSRDRDQLFAEALVRYRDKEQWWPERDFEARCIRPVQEAYREVDAWEEPIAAYLDRAEHGERITTAGIAVGALGLMVGSLNTGIARRLSAVMRNLEWVQKRTKTGRYWEKAA